MFDLFERRLALPVLRIILNIASFASVVVVCLGLIAAALSFIFGQVAGNTQLAFPQVKASAINYANSDLSYLRLLERREENESYSWLRKTVKDDPELLEPITDFAILADPEKGKDFFIASDLADAAILYYSNPGENFYDDDSMEKAFSLNLLAAFRSYRETAPDVDFKLFVVSFIEAWTKDGEAKIDRYLAAMAQAAEAEESLRSSIVVALGAFALFMAAAFALAITLIERNTRLPNKSIEP